MLATNILPLLTALAGCGFFYWAAQEERYSGVLWGGLSILVSLAAILGLHGGIFTVLLGQLGLFAAITAYRVWREP